ncbi:hypothetical protein Tdes44962_MAKER01640 [Teratosphaeria destructans]|uniref:BTB domain-containing protein n=1 Tax=Teratosphaeria destructans TaxID=418781 RepID=A0A9W7W558_9PEZI|nr:hypothetical protein Tdes44962_MAKER01640 [Teratosphaeria destructans]
MAPTTRRNSALLRKIATLQLKLSPLVPLPSGPPHPNFPKTLMAFHLLTEDELDSIAHYYHQSTPGPWSHHYPANMNWDKDFLARPAPPSASASSPRRRSRRLSQQEQEFLTDLMRTVEDLQNPGVPSTEGEGSGKNPYDGLSEKDRVRIKRRKIGKFIGLVGMETPAEEIAGRVQASYDRVLEGRRQETARAEEVMLRRTKMDSKSSSKDAAREGVLTQLANHQTDPDLCDFTITCGPQAWPVHRLVLCLHSPVLAKWCKGAFAEVRTHRVDLSDQEDPACVEGLIHYLYRLGYKDPARGALRYHVQMCVLADKYDIPPLKQLAVARFREVAEKEYAGAAFAEAAAEAFEVAGATAEICEVVAGLAVKHRLLAPSNEGGSAFRGVAKGCPELLMAVLGRMQEEADRDVRKEGPELQEEMCYECPDCGWCIDEDSIKRGMMAHPVDRAESSTRLENGARRRAR